MAQAPQIPVDDSVAKALAALGQTVGQVAERWVQRQKEQQDFDDQIKYQHHEIGQQRAALDARSGMSAQATGFHDSFMASREKADRDFLQTVSPANRSHYEGRLSVDRDRASLAAAEHELRGRGAYERSQLDQSAADLASQVRANPGLAPAALKDLRTLHTSQSSVPHAEREAQWRNAEQTVQLAAYRGQDLDEPAASRPTLPLRNRHDPRFPALTPELLQQADNERNLAFQQNQAAAHAELHQALQTGLPDLMLSGRWNGAPVTKAQFLAAHGKAEGVERFDAFRQAQRNAPSISALLHLPEAQLDEALRRHADAPGNDGQDFHASLTEAAARLREDRAKDPVRALGQLYPSLGQGWASYTKADAQTQKQLLPGLIARTADLMEKAGWPADQRVHLPKAVVSRVVDAFGDVSKPVAERIAPLRDLVAAISDKKQQQTIFTQAVDAGIPRLLAPAIAAYGRGDVDAAGRLFQAAAGDATRQEPIAGSETEAAKAATPSPAVQLKTGQDGFQSSGLGNRQIDLRGSVSRQLAILDDAGLNFEDHPLTALLRDRLIRQNYQTNGGDIAAAEALARQDLRQPGALRYAQAMPRTMVDVPMDGGAVVTNPTVPPVDSISSKTIVKTPEAPIAPANENTPLAPDLPPVSPARPGLPKGSTSQADLTPLEGGGGRGPDPVGIALFYRLNRPQDVLETYPSSTIPKSYTLSPFDGTRIAPEISSFALKLENALPQRSDAKFDALAKSEEFGAFNGAVNAARRDLFFDDDYSTYRQYYSAGGYDISFAPSKDPDGKAVVVAVRKSGRQPYWFSSPFGDKGEEPGPWWGTPAPESRPEAPSPPNAEQAANDPDDLALPKPTPLTPSSGADDPYDEADLQAGLKAGLTDQAAQAMARENYRNRASYTEKNEDQSLHKQDIARVGFPRPGTTEVSVSELSFTHPVPRPQKSDEHITALANNMKKNGFDLDQAIQIAQMPDKTLIVLGGNHRLAAMKYLNQKTIPARIFKWNELSDNQRGFYRERFPYVFGNY